MRFGFTAPSFSRPSSCSQPCRSYRAFRICASSASCSTNLAQDAASQLLYSRCCRVTYRAAFARILRQFRLPLYSRSSWQPVRLLYVSLHRANTLLESRSAFPPRQHCCCSQFGSQPSSKENQLAAVSCPKCNTLNQQAGWPAWVIVVAICFFPIGLLALLSGRKPTVCRQCGFAWNA